MHVLLPHEPWLYLPTGQQFTALRQNVGLLRNGRWVDDRWAAAVNHQRYLLQLGYVDTLLGRLVARLREVDVYGRRADRRHRGPRRQPAARRVVPTTDATFVRGRRGGAALREAAGAAGGRGGRRQRRGDRHSADAGGRARGRAAVGRRRRRHARSGARAAARQGDVLRRREKPRRGAARRRRRGGGKRRAQVRVVRDGRPARYSRLSRPLRRVDRPAGRPAAGDAALRPSGGCRHLPAAAGRRSGRGVPPCPHNRCGAGPAGRCAGPDARGRSQRGGRGDHPAVLVPGPRSSCRLGGDRRSGATRAWRQRAGGVRDSRRARRRLHRAGGRGRLQPRWCVAQPPSWTRSFRCSGGGRPGSTVWNGRMRDRSAGPAEMRGCCCRSIPGRRRSRSAC